jgi:putative peptide zinc metalloprotease protein
VSKDFGRTVSADIVRYLVEERLRPLGVLAATNGSSTMLPRAKLGVLALWFRTPMVPEGVVQAFTAVFRPLFFAPVVIVVLAGFAALDFWLFFIHGISWSTVVEALYRPENFLTVFGLGILAASFHELGHATACRYGGAKPGRIGAGIYLIWPVFYSDVTDAYRLSKAGRLRVDLGGVYFNAIFWLAIAGAYFLTESEVLLIAVFFGQLAMLYQFMPFVRLDGYYVVSDLTGVPDLFARIKPTLRSMIPGRGTDTRVLGELKPWVRVAITAWVLITIPALIYLLARLTINAPFMYTTAWDSFLVNYDIVLSAFGEGRVVGGVAGLIRIVLLIFPVVGLPLLYALIGKRLSEALWSWLGGKPLLRARPASALPRRDSRLEEELKRAEETYDDLVQRGTLSGTKLAELIREGRDLEELGRHRRDLLQLTQEADQRRTELKHALLERRAKRAEHAYRHAAEEASKAARSLEQARKAYAEADKAARHLGLEARRLAQLRDNEVRHLQDNFGVSSPRSR